MLFIVAGLIHFSETTTRQWTAFCEKYIVAHDPWPYAEISTTTLLISYRLKKDPLIEKELTYRYQVGMLSPDESKEFELLFDNIPEHKEDNDHID